MNGVWPCYKAGWEKVRKGEMKTGEFKGEGKGLALFSNLVERT